MAHLSTHFKGPTAVAISYGDPVGLAKILVDYAKENEVFKLRGAVFEGRPLGQAEIATLATLPSLEALRGKLVGLLQAPAGQLARLLAAPGSQLARVIEARHKALAEGGDGASAPAQAASESDAGIFHPAAGTRRTAAQERLNAHGGSERNR